MSELKRAAPERQLQRVPPHDPTLEAHLLGAATLSVDAARLVAGLDPDVWYRPNHGHIAAAIADLYNSGQPTDTGTLSAHLKQLGWLDTVGGYVAVIDMQADTPSTYSAANWADRLHAMWRQRQVLTAASEVVEAIYRGVSTSGLVAQLTAASAELDRSGPSTWEPVNLASVLAGEGPDIVPTVLARDDGVMLVYPGKVHAINAEPEAGKSWVCCVAAAQQLAAGRHVVYVDFEADAADLTNRLLTLGTAPSTIIEQFHYIRPQDPVAPTAVSRVVSLAAAYEASLVVIDGVTEAMASAGWSINDNDDVARFLGTLPRPIAAAGPAVILVDHVVKDRDQRGRYGIGGQHKLAGIDGAVYTLEIVKPFGRGKPGMSRLLVAKDRHGQVRAHASAGARAVIADVHYDAGDDGAMGVRITAPEASVGTDGDFQPTGLMEAVSRWLELHPRASTNDIKDAIKGKSEYVRQALDVLIEHGRVQVGEGARRAKIHTVVEPYRESEGTL